MERAVRTTRSSSTIRIFFPFIRCPGESRASLEPEFAIGASTSFGCSDSRIGIGGIGWVPIRRSSFAFIEGKISYIELSAYRVVSERLSRGDAGTEARGTAGAGSFLLDYRRRTRRITTCAHV